VLFDNNFGVEETVDEAGVELEDWVLNGNALYIPGVDNNPIGECINEFGEVAVNTESVDNPCTVYGEARLEDLGLDPEEFGGYVMATPGLNGQAGNAFRTEKSEYDNFKLTVVVELRDGSRLDKPADGMVVVVVGTDDPPAETGSGGGGMGAPCVGQPDNAPVMAWEFDNWDCNASDGPFRPDIDHVGFYYGANGMTCTDNVPTELGAHTAIGFGKLHNRQPPSDDLSEHAPANRYQMEVFAQRCGDSGLTVAMNLLAIDTEEDFGRVFTHVVPDFLPFEGYLGVTASTGGSNQSHILHSARLEELPDDFCLQPAAGADRSIGAQGDAAFRIGDFADGDIIPVTLTLKNVRVASDCCATAEAVVIRDDVPVDWVITSAGQGGTILDGGGAVEWSFGPGGNATVPLANDNELTYTVEAVDDGVAIFYCFQGSVVEDVPQSIPVQVDGDRCARNNSPYDDCGGLVAWNLLGPYSQAGGAGPGDVAIQEDYLTDGDTTELDFVFFPGAVINTDYNGAAASLDLIDTRQAHVNPGGVPTVLPWNDADSHINTNDDVYDGNPDNCMYYGQIYAINNTGDDIEATFNVGSDDSVQVIVNGEEVWVHSIPRGVGTACGIQDVVPDGFIRVDPIVFEPGENSIIVKVFEGGGGMGHHLAIFDIDGFPISAEDLSFSKFPDGACPFTPFVATRSIDTGATTRVQGIEVPAWSAGETYTVEITLSDEREAGDACDGFNEGTLTETVPAGWTVSDISGGGVQNGQEITWTISAGGVDGTTLTYRVSTPDEAEDVAFFGAITEPGAVLAFGVGGDGKLSNPVDLTAFGFWRKWLVLGPYQQPGGFGFGAAPNTSNIEHDWLTDGEVFETEVEPRAGDTIETIYGGSAAPPDESLAIGLAQSPGRADLNPDGTPTWYVWIDSDDTLAYEDVHGGDLNQIMQYAVIYCVVDEDITVDIGLGSDDSVSVLLDGGGGLDGAPLWTNSVARGSGGSNVIQDIVPGVFLEAGLHQFMVKVFEGGGGFNFRMRFQNEFAEPVIEGFSLCFSPDPEECGADVVPTEDCDAEGDEDGNGLADCADPACADLEQCQGGGFVRGDANANGSIDLTDGVVTLNFLFTGGDAPVCMDAADADDNGGLVISDAVIVFSWLFTGGAAPVDPTPRATAYSGEDCGPDPTDDDPLDCSVLAPQCE